MFSQIAVLVVLILLNAYFAASEIAFISLNDAKIEKQAKEGNKKAKQIYKMLKNPSKFLATIQIGITLAGFLSSAFASDAFADKLAPMLNNLLPMLGTDTWRTISIILITILLSFFTLVFGELVPKRLAMKYYEKVSFGTIGVIRGISFITAPFVKLLTFSTNVISKIFGVKENEEEIVTEEEIKMMIDEGEEKGTIDQEEKELLNNVFEFNDTTASEIMTPRIDIFALKISQDLYEVLDELDDYKYSRIPVYEDTIDNIKGIILIKDILKDLRDKKKINIKKLIKEVHFVPESVPIDKLFRQLQRNKMQMAIVIDEYGGTAGLVTMEDILEELVGNIFDEHDEEELEYELIDENTYMVNGNISIGDLEKIIGIEISDGDYETLSGYLLGKLEELPPEGEEKYNENDRLNIKVLRNNKEKECYAVLKKDKNGNLTIGIYLAILNNVSTKEEVTYVFKNNESGSSRGLMCALEIYNRITDFDITKGDIIAGTGSIEADGTVGDIDGVKYKIKGAVKNKAKVFIVPSGNYDEALKLKEKNNYDIELIKADNLHNVIENLKNR